MYKTTIVILAIIIIGVLPVFGEVAIPEWFYKVYQYWKDDKITRSEFSNAISYLQKINTLKLEEDSDPITSFLLSDSLIRQNENHHGLFSNCTTGWYITGYFTPIELDYSGKFIDVLVDKKPYKFKEDFVTEVKTEGWGKTISGNYLGWYDESFHLSDVPLDAMGGKLEINSVAVDPSLIVASSKIIIPSLPDPWSAFTFTSSDTGTAIIGKHIDVYTGEGKTALNETYRITGHDNMVCLEVN